MGLSVASEVVIQLTEFRVQATSSTRFCSTIYWRLELFYVERLRKVGKQFASMTGLLKSRISNI